MLFCCIAKKNILKKNGMIVYKPQKYVVNRNVVSECFFFPSFLVYTFYKRDKALINFVDTPMLFFM